MDPRRLLRLLVLLLALLPGLAPPAPAASEEEQTRTRLRQLQEDIRRINREISSDSKRRSQLQEQLREAEVKRGRLQRQIDNVRGEIEAARRRLAELEGERDTLQRARDAQQQRIALELRAAWQLGRQGQLRVLLNQDDPQTVARAMAYYRYFFDARNTLLESYRETLARLALVQEEIGDAVDRLASRRATLEREQAALEANRREREAAVAGLNASIADKGARLAQLERDRRELEEVLRAVEEAVVELEVPEDFQPFGAAKGRMPWPVEGRRSNSFGRPRNEGKMRWQGVTIPAKEGTRVRAIHHGRVVYADWLRGSGLLLIIDHGDGYMSLYAHNQSLLKDVGEWVTAGSPVSTVGNSGGQEQPALYFEIRHKGKPVDPTGWCRG